MIFKKRLQEPEKNSIHNRLKSQRKRSKLTQVELAGIGGVAEITQRNYEAGRSVPDAIYLSRVADAIDVTYLLTGVSSQVPIETVDKDKIRVDLEAPVSAMEAPELSEFFKTIFDLDADIKIQIKVINE